jgi:hypothetical protein
MLRLTPSELCWLPFDHARKPPPFPPPPPTPCGCSGGGSNKNRTRSTAASPVATLTTGGGSPKTRCARLKMASQRLLRSHSPTTATRFAAEASCCNNPIGPSRRAAPGLRSRASGREGRATCSKQPGFPSTSRSLIPRKAVRGGECWGHPAPQRRWNRRARFDHLSGRLRRLDSIVAEGDQKHRRPRQERLDAIGHAHPLDCVRYGRAPRSHPGGGRACRSLRSRPSLAV